MVLTLGISIVLSVLLLSWEHNTVLAKPARVIVAPVDVITPLGSIPAQFNCTSVGGIDWHIYLSNGSSYSPHQLAMDGVVEDPSSTRGEFSTLSIEVTRDKYNNTGVECNPSTTESSDVSDIVNLTIAGPPLAPSPTFEIFNGTAIGLSWEKPFAIEQFDVTNYTVRVTNSSNGAETIDSILVASNYTQLDSEGSSPLMYRYVMNSNDSIALGSCHELLFNVTASNAAGESNGGLVSGEFPIVPGIFEAPSVYEHYVLNNHSELIPRITINFTLPLLCRFQTANYTVSIFKVDAQLQQDAVYLNGLLMYEGGEGNRHIQFTVEHDLLINTSYTGEVVVKSVSGKRSVRFEFTIGVISNSSSSTQQPFNTDDINDPVKSTVNSRSINYKALVGGSVGGAVSILLILAIILVCVVITMRMVKRKRVIIRQTSELSELVAKAYEKMEPNPIYSSESPIYDQIIDIQTFKSPPSGAQMKANMESHQYSEVNTVQGKTTQQNCKLADDYKLHSMADETYTIMNPVGTLRSTVCKDQNLATGSVNGQIDVSAMPSRQCNDSTASPGNRNNYDIPNKLFGLKEQDEENRYVKMS